MRKESYIKTCNLLWGRSIYIPPVPKPCHDFTIWQHSRNEDSFCFKICHFSKRLKNRCDAFFCYLDQQGMHFQRNLIYQTSSYQNRFCIGRFHTLWPYSAYSKTWGTDVILWKKKLISLILLICSKQNTSHSSIGYWP